MAEFAVVVSKNAYLASVGAIVDSFAVADERRQRVLDDDGSTGPVMRLTYLSIDGQDVTLDPHTTVKIDRPISSDDRFDFIWLPAFRLYGETGLRDALQVGEPLRQWLRVQAESGAVIGASGAAAALLIGAGLINGRKVPIAPALIPPMRSLSPRSEHDEQRAMVDYGDIAISDGIGHDLALISHLLERLLSPQSSRWLRSVTGADYEADDATVADPLVAAARARLEQRFTSPVSIRDLAAELATSHSTLIRRFRAALGKTPNGYVVALRLAAAKRLLAQSNRSVDKIAALVGYADGRNFRAMFHQQAGMTATQWRRAQHRPE